MKNVMWDQNKSMFIPSVFMEKRSELKTCQNKWVATLTKRQLLVLFLGLAFMAAALAGCSSSTADGNRYTIKALVQEANLYGGTNGLCFDNDDNLYIGAVAGATIFNVDTETGESSVFLGAPNGGADDIVFAPDGTMYWNAFFLGKVFKMDTSGNITLLAENIAGANALDLDAEGNLYVTQVFFGDALWKIDTTGNMNNVLIGENYGGLNGFEIGTDGYIYGPLWFNQQVVKIDPASGVVVEVIADGFSTPCAVNFDSQGNLYALDTGTGEIFRIDIESGDKTVVAVQAPHLDNLAIDSSDRIFVTNMNTNGLYEVMPNTGEIRTVVEDKLVFPQGLAVESGPSGDILYVSDNFAYKTIDPDTGDVECPENGSKFVYTCSISEDGQHVLMTGWNDNSIKVYNKATAAAEYTISGVQVPTDSYMLADGSVLALEALNGRLVRITNQDYTTAEIIAEGLANPTFMTPAGSEETALYVTEYGAGQITKINYETGEKTVICNTLSGPEGIAVNTDGHLLVLDSISETLVDVDPATGATTVMVEDLPIGILASSPQGPAASPLSDIAVSESGAIYFTSPLTNNVYQVVAE